MKKVSVVFSFITINVLIGGQAASAVSSGLQNWSTAYAQAKYSVVNVVVFGDSLTSCYQPSCGTEGPTSAAVRYADQLRAYFESAGISHGTGIIPVETLLVGPDINTSFWSLSGRFSESSIIGPAQANLPFNNGGALIQMAPGATATLAAQTGDTLKVYCAETTDSTSGLNVQIDGTSVGTACGISSSTPAALVQTFRPATGLGSHKVVLTSNTTGNSYLYGAEWSIGTAGVSVHNVALGAAVAEAYGSNVRSQLAFSDLIQGGTQLAIILLGTNEPGLNVPVSTYSTSISNLAQHEQSIGASVLVIAPPPLGVSPEGDQLPAYQAAAQQVAGTLGAAYLDFSQWGNYAQASLNGLYQSDGIHLSDSGQNRLFEMIAQDIFPAADTAPAFNGGTISNPLNLNTNISPSAGTAFAESVVNSNTSGISSVLFGSNSCTNNSNSYWLGETGATYGYSIPDAFVLYDCNTAHFPFLVFPSGNISIAGNSYGLSAGGIWTNPTDQGVSLQVSGGLNTDSLRVSGALNAGTVQAAGTVTAAGIQAAGVVNAPTIQLGVSTSQPTCDESSRGTFLFVPSVPFGADHLEVCAKTSAFAYGWVTIF